MENESTDSAAIVPAIDTAEVKDALEVIPETEVIAFRSDEDVDFNNLELVHPDDLEPNDARNMRRYTQFIQPRMEYILAMRREKLTRAQVAKNLGVSEHFLSLCAQRYPELQKVLTVGYQDAISEIKSTAFKTAMGFEHTFKRQKIMRDGTIIPYEERIWVPPNVDMIKFLLITQAEGYNPKTITDVNLTGKLTLGALMQTIDKEQQADDDKELPPPKIN
jgi:hypothetical protein